MTSPAGGPESPLPHYPTNPPIGANPAQVVIPLDARPLYNEILKILENNPATPKFEAILKHDSIMPLQANINSVIGKLGDLTSPPPIKQVISAIKFVLKTLDEMKGEAGKMKNAMEAGNIVKEAINEKKAKSLFIGIAVGIIALAVLGIILATTGRLNTHGDVLGTDMSPLAIYAATAGIFVTLGTLAGLAYYYKTRYKMQNVEPIHQDMTKLNDLKDDLISKVYQLCDIIDKVKVGDKEKEALQQASKELREVLRMQLPEENNIELEEKTN